MDILISGCRPTLDSVGSMTSESGVGENMGIHRNFSDISIQSRDIAHFQFLIAILVSGCRPTSDSVDSMTIESGVVENVGVATGISQISQSSPEI